jgi:Fe-S-cluster containining protein
MNNLKFSNFQLSKYHFIFPNVIIWKCQRCTLCCKDSFKHIRHIKLLRQEGIALSRKIKIPIERFTIPTLDKIYSHEILKNNGKCIFLKDDVCKIYDSRPLVCRFYPFEMKLIEKDVYQILFSGKECNAIDKGEKLNETFFRELAKNALKHFTD